MPFSFPDLQLHVIHCIKFMQNVHMRVCGSLGVHNVQHNLPAVDDYWSEVPELKVVGIGVIVEQQIFSMFSVFCCKSLKFTEKNGITQVYNHTACVLLVLCVLLLPQCLFVLQ